MKSLVEAAIAIFIVYIFFEWQKNNQAVPAATSPVAAVAASFMEGSSGGNYMEEGPQSVMVSSGVAAPANSEPCSSCAAVSAPALSNNIAIPVARTTTIFGMPSPSLPIYQLPSPTIAPTLSTNIARPISRIVAAPASRLAVLGL